jgi:hypothetical protein
MNGQDFSKAAIIDNRNGTVTIDSYVCWLTDGYVSNTLPKVNIQRCRHSFECQGHKLTSLKYIPKIIPGDLVCYDNPLISLEGIELDSYIGNEILLTYTPTLPLLRTVKAKNGVLFQDKNSDISSGNDIDVIRKIIHIHCKNPNIKQAIYNCQYDLIKSGFKGNARW